MRADVLIVGQGLAGSLLGWELERAGIPFAIADPGMGDAASAVAAGIINPITGRRLVQSWRIETLLPAARATYRDLEAALQASLWHDMRIHRRFADDGERQAFARKRTTGALAPFVEGGDDDVGFWISGAARVDTSALLAKLRSRWQLGQKFIATALDPVAEVQRYQLVVDCRGREAALNSDAWRFVPWEFSKGEIIELTVVGMEPDVILHRREWVVPIAANAALVGATHEPGVTDPAPSVAARTRLEAAARDLLGNRPFGVFGQRVGVRVNLPDKRPVAGRHPGEARLGLNNGLGAKGALWAPWLAHEWVRHLTTGVAFDAEVAVQRWS